MPALLASVMWTAPSESTQVIQESTVPQQRSRVRSGSAASSNASNFVAATFGASRYPDRLQLEAATQGAQVLPTDPGSDRRTGRPVPHDRRARAGSRSRPHRPFHLRRAQRRAVSRAASAIARASNSTSPGAGESGRSDRLCSCATVASGRTIALRTELVPTSTTNTLTCATFLRPGGGAAGPGVGEAELAGVEDAVRVERVLHRLEHGEARRRAPRARSGPG